MEKIMIDVNDVAAAIGVPKKEVEMMGHKMMMTAWSAEYMPAIAEHVGKLVESGAPASLGGPGDHWVLAGAAAAMGDSFVEYVAGQGPMDIIDLPLGEVSAEGGVTFRVRDDGDKLYVFFDPDDHTKPSMGPHNYDVSLLPKVVVPACRPDQDVFCESNGAYGIALTILKAYFGKCRSLSVSPGHGSDTGYVCVIPGGSLKLGDVSPYCRLD